MTLSERIAQYIDGIHYQDLTEEAIQQAKSCLLDWVAVTVAGAREEVTERLLQSVTEFGGREQATVIGKGIKLSLPFAALVNGTSSHALDYDDVYVKTSGNTGFGHPSAPVVPSILALSEWKGLSGKELILSLVVGIQVEYAIGEGMIPEHYDQGWHNTGTIGHFGAAAGASKLLHLNPSSIVHAIGIAATQAAGLRQVFGTMCKPLHAGKAAMNGLLSALWAEKGMNSSADVLDGELGFLKIYSSNPHPEKVDRSLSDGYHVLKARFKDYPSCRGTHAVIDGVVELRKRYPFRPDEVREIHCTVAPLAYEINKNPCPRTGMEAKFSLAHCAAAAWIEGPLYCSHFGDDRIGDPLISQLRERVRISTDPDLLTSQSKIEILLRSGLKHEFFSDIYGPEKEKTGRERLYEKSSDILEPLIGKKRWSTFIRSMEHLEAVKNVSEVIRSLS